MSSQSCKFDEAGLILQHQTRRSGIPKQVVSAGLQSPSSAEGRKKPLLRSSIILLLSEYQSWFDVKSSHRRSKCLILKILTVFISVHVLNIICSSAPSLYIHYVLDYLYPKISRRVINGLKIARCLRVAYLCVCGNKFRKTKEANFTRGGFFSRYFFFNGRLWERDAAACKIRRFNLWVVKRFFGFSSAAFSSQPHPYALGKAGYNL